MQLPIDEVDYTLFQASTMILLGDVWLNSVPLHNVAPSLYQIAARKNRTVQEALNDGKWIAGLTRKITKLHLVDFVNLFIKLGQIVLTPHILDGITWKWIPSGEYTAKSTYMAQFLGSIKIFAWLLI